MKKIGIIIVNFNGNSDTLECLSSIEKVDIKQIELTTVVVDNGSLKPFDVDSKKYRTQKVVVLKNGENLGFTGGNNVGIAYLLEQKVDYIMLLNNDTIVDKNVVRNLAAVLDSQEKIAIVAPKIYFAKGYEYHKDRYATNDTGNVIWYAGGMMDWKNVIGHHRGVDEVDMGQYDKQEVTDYASGCCLMIRREVIEKWGMFDNDYFLYYEESDLCERIKRFGKFQIIFVPSAFIWHKNAQSSGGSGSELQDYYITRNRMIFGMRYAPIRTKFALYRESIQLLLRGRPWQKKGMQDYYLSRFGKGSFKI